MVCRVAQMTSVQAPATRASAGPVGEGGVASYLDDRSALPAHPSSMEERSGGMGQSPEIATESLCSAHAAGDRSKNPRMLIPCSSRTILSRPTFSWRSSIG